MSEVGRESGEMSMQELLRVLEIYGEVELQDVTIHVDKLVLKRSKEGRSFIEVNQR